MTIASRIRGAVIGLAIGVVGTSGGAAIGYVSARAQPAERVSIEAARQLSIAPSPLHQLPGQPPVVTAPPAIMDATPYPIVLSDPTADPLGSIDDAAAAKRHGWPALVLAIAIMLALGLRSIGKRYPDVGWLSWINEGKRAFWIASVIGVGGAVFDVIALGGTAYAAGWAGLAALLALLNAKGNP